MVRIALISDIHFGKFSRTYEFTVPGEPIQDENEGAISLMNSLVTVLKENNVQYIFVAGDLTSVGSPQEFHYCEQKILSIAQDAGVPKDRIILGLGNHDIDWRISRICDDYLSSIGKGFPIELVREKYQLIAASAPLYNMNQITKPSECGPAPFSGLVENDKFIVFILNSGWCCTHDQSFPHGKLSNDQLEWFRLATERYKADTRWKIVLMHHHPFNYTYHIPSIDISMIEEGSSFLDIAGKNGVNLVLHGHRHHPQAETIKKIGWEHPITFVCAGSLTVNSVHRSNGDIPNTLHMIELAEEPGVLTLYNFQYSPAQGWIQLKNNCPETPLDFEMMLGKLYDPEIINNSICKLTSSENEILWRELDDCLRFLTIDELNKRVKDLLSETHKMIGLFPDEVFLIKK